MNHSTAWSTTASSAALDRQEAASRLAVGVMKISLTVAATVGVGNYTDLLVPKAFAVAQQYLSLIAWCAAIAASFTVRTRLRTAQSIDLVLACAFVGLAAGSVVWTELLPASVLKSLALLITTYSAYRMALCLSVRDTVGCVTLGLALQAAVSLILVAGFPKIGIVQAWMHNGQWSGLFESKQSLGTIATFLIFFSGYRLLAGGRWLPFLITFGMAVACTIGSGSRGGGATALAAIAILYLTSRSRRLTALFAVSPVLMIALAYGLLWHLYLTDRPYYDIGGERIDLTERTFIWHHGLHRFDEAPLFGFGINGFWTDSWIGYAFQREHGWLLDNFHSGYLTILMETGLVGALLFTAWFVFFGLRMVFVPRSRTLSEADARLIISYTVMMFLFDFTETFFLRSTNVIMALMMILYFRSTLFETSERPRRTAAMRFGSHVRPTMHTGRRAGGEPR